MKIVVVGGGFGGIKTALLLSKNRQMNVTLISDKDYFVYYPALYAVATGGAQRQSFVPLDQIFVGCRVRVVHDRIVGYDPVRRLVRGRAKEYSYDRVVFALGSVTSYFGIQGLEEYSFGIKSHTEVTKFRNHLHDELTSTRSLDKQYVIVGAGPTGVELASSLAQHIRHIARAHDIRDSRLRIKLVEAAPRILPRMSEATSRSVAARLRAIGVHVLCGEKVEWQDGDEVCIGGRSLSTHTVVWTSGVANHPFFEKHRAHFRFAANHKVQADDHLMVGPRSYVIGDNAATPYSGLAQTALRDAHFVARDITRAARRQTRPAYKPWQPPVVVPVGKDWALLEWHWLRITGRAGHLLRRCADLIGYHDILPLKLALSAWQAEDSLESPCVICQNKR